MKLKKTLLLSFGVSLVAGVWVFHEPLRQRISEGAALTNPAPPANVLEETIEKSPDRAGAIVAAWNTGKIVHREVAMREIVQLISADVTLKPELEAIVLAGALDVDLSVRELALSGLSRLKHPSMGPLAAAQLRDCDPQIRLLGVNYLRGVPADFGIATVMPLLNDADPLVTIAALKCLENWTGQKFGVRLSDAVAGEDEKTGLIEYPADARAKAVQGVQLAKSWWTAHQSEFPGRTFETPPVVALAQKPIPAAEFSLRTLEGRPVSLAGLRGKVALINFWTTWCPACVGEMPGLVALKKQQGERLTILGVSLDFVPDSHGHIGGHSATENDDGPTLASIREKVARTAATRGLNYPILLDEANEVGGQFNGGELPTTVIVDAQGNIRRRFIGARSLAVFEAMIAEAGQPAPAIAVK